MKKLFACLLLCFPLPAPAESLPDLGDVAQATLTPIQEKQIGQQSMMQIRASKQFLDDPEVNDYLNRLGYRLVEHSSEPGLGFEFFALDNNEVNAFALPGGFIGVNSGLLLTAQSESELASVLSHEIAHVTQHHMARMVDGGKNDTLAALAAVAVAIVAARQSPQVSQAALATMQARAVQNQLNYTRANEEEADRVGLDLLKHSSFNVHAMPSFLGQLQKATRLVDGNLPNYLRTHPVTDARVADIENRVQDEPFKLVPDSFDFQLVHAKLLAASKSPEEAERYFSTALSGANKHGNPLVQRYGLTLALLAQNKSAAALKEYTQLEKAAEVHPASRSNAMLAVLGGRVLTAIDTKQALAHYKQAVLSHPENRALAYDYATLLLEGKDADAALAQLKDRVARHPSDTRLYELLARAYAQLGNALEQHQAQAYRYAWQGNLHAAIEQLELAKQAGGDFYQRATIDSELKELREMMGEPKKK